MIHVRRRLVSLVCLPLVLFSACGDGDSDADEPSTPSPSSSQLASPSTFPSPSESASTLPEDLPADEVDPEEIVRAWIQAYDHASGDGDTSRMRAMSTDDCFSCDSIAKSVENVYSKGGSIDLNTKPTEISSLKIDPESTPTSTQVTIKLTFPPGTIQQSASDKPSHFESTSETWDMYLAVIDDRWVVTGIGI